MKLNKILLTLKRHKFVKKRLSEGLSLQEVPFFCYKIMDEAYKILPTEDHEKWTIFKDRHSEKTTNYCRSILGDNIPWEEFRTIYKRLSSTKKGKQKRKNAASTYKRMISFGWIQ